MEQDNNMTNVQTGASISASEQNNMMAEGSEKKKGGNGMLYGMILCAILAVGGIGFGVWAMMDGNSQVAKKDEQISTLKKHNSELQEQLSNNTVENDLSDDSARTCSGTYYGEASGTLSNGLSYDLKYTYILNDDGTFSADHGGTSGTDGKYMINDNTISLVGHVETGGSRDEATSYVTKDYIITDDCSLIKVNDGEVRFELKKQ